MATLAPIYRTEDRAGTCWLIVSPAISGFTWLWHFPGSLEDLRRRWPELDVVHRSFQKWGPMPANSPAHGEFEDLAECSLGTILSYDESSDARMKVDQDGAKVTPKSGPAFVLPWPKPGA